MIVNNIRTSVAAAGVLVILLLSVSLVVLWQSGTFGSRVDAPTLGQGPVVQEEVALTDPPSLDAQLVKAEADGDLAKLTALLEAGADVNAESSPGRPVLFLAVVRGNVDVVRLLLDHGADVNAETVDGAILVKAAHEGHREIVEMLLDAGADINATGRAWAPDDSALYAAALGRHGDIARLLVERGADVNQADSLGETPLLVAVGRGQPEIVTLLLENGADIDHQTNEGMTALHLAAYTPAVGASHPEIAQILIDNGATFNIKDAKGRTPLDIASSDVAELLRQAGAQE